MTVVEDKLNVTQLNKPKHTHTHKRKHKPQHTLSSTTPPHNNQQLTLTQRKNAYKRQRKKLQCFVCGETGHTKSKCKHILDVTPDTICLACRQTGHTAKTCPTIQHSTVPYIQHKSDVVLCYNCGQLGHALRDCMQPIVNNGLTYAECFVCHSKGHLASKCENNEFGRYGVLGHGECHKCKSKQHLVKDCPELTEQDRLDRKQELREQDAHRRKVQAKLSVTGGDALDDDYISDNNISDDEAKKHKHKRKKR